VKRSNELLGGGTSEQTLSIGACTFLNQRSAQIVFADDGHRRAKSVGVIGLHDQFLARLEGWS
jgi:hypothetical protein